jgi:integrase
MPGTHSQGDDYLVTSNFLAVPDPQSTVQKSEFGEENPPTSATPSNENLTQSDPLPSRQNPTTHPEISRAQQASTAPSPISHEEVSGMPINGNGCIFKVHNKAGKAVWKIEVTIGHRPDGKRIRTRRTAHSLAAAREIQRQLIAELHTGDLRTKSSETLKDYSLWWLKTVKAMRVRPSSLADYEYRLRRNAFPHFGLRRLHDITSRDIENWLHTMQQSGIATSTINGARQVVGSVFKHAVKSGMIAKNPVDLTERARRLPGEKTSVQPPWSLSEAQHVLEVTRGTEFDLFARLGVLLGARRGEILAVKWQDIDFEKGSLAITGSLREQRTIQLDGSTRTSLVVGDTKTLSSRRKLALTAEVLASIQRHRDVIEARRKSAGSRWQETDWVFVDSIGGLTYPSNFAKRFNGFLRDNGVRRIRIHDMRHTSAVLSLEAGVRLEAVSQPLGHSRIDITKSVYAPYVQPLITEFAFGLSDYVAPVDALDFNRGSEYEVAQ